MAQLVSAGLAVAVAIGGLVVLFAALNWVGERLPQRWQRAVKPLLYAAPALFLLGLVLVYPTVETIRVSFFDATSTHFVGLRNYRHLAESAQVRAALRNNALWLLVVPAVTIAVGLAIAVMADRLKRRWEITAKTLVFLPMAISFVGASTIWGFIYAFQPAGSSQTGLLNALWTSLGFKPVAWLTNAPWNSLLLMAILVWLQSGLAMVLLSAAIKNVPHECVEAARVDAATEWQIFWRVVLPQIKPTIAVVLSTLVILVLKVFDIVYVMTNGNFDTDVVAVRFINEIFTYNNFGHAAALVVVLLALTTPIVYFTVRRFRAEVASR